MQIGSLFSGIGALDLGLQQAGHEHTFFCEADSYRRDVLKRRFSGVPVFADVCSLGEPTWGTTPDDTGTPVDLRRWEAGTGLLCGGFPCQDLSVAGKRAGLKGKRSGLFFQFARVASYLRPRHVLVENVPGIFSSNGGRDFGIVLETLAHLGYGLAWRVLDSRYFGVPQRRRRVFIVGTLAGSNTRAGAERSGQILAVGQSCSRHPVKGKKKGKDYSVASIAGLGSGGADDNDAENGGLVVAHTLSSRYGKGINTTMDDGAVIVAPTLSTKNEVASSSAQRWAWMNQSAELMGKVRRLTPRECERLQGLPDDWTELGGTADTKRYAAIGDAVTVNVAHWIGERLWL